MVAAKPWHEEYYTALLERDKREGAHKDLIRAYQSVASRAPPPPRPSAALERIQRRCRDLEDESKTKDKLVQQAHDELLVLNIEKNMFEKREKELRRENEELVRRWRELENSGFTG